MTYRHVTARLPSRPVWPVRQGADREKGAKSRRRRLSSWWPGAVQSRLPLWAAAIGIQVGAAIALSRHVVIAVHPFTPALLRYASPVLPAALPFKVI